jgi:hypothetical protein
MSRYVQWDEPFDSQANPPNIVCRMIVDDAIRAQRNIARSRGHEYETDERALDDFLAAHWAVVTGASALDWQACAQAILNDPRVDQIRRAHASARPKAENPAWRNTHHDLGYVLHMLARHAAGYFGPVGGET